MSHTMTITRLPDEESDNVLYMIGGEHDRTCEVYMPCQKDWHRHPKNDEIVGDEWASRDGKYHAYIDGGWMVPRPGGCGFDYVFEQCQDDYLIEKGLGTFDVILSWDGDWWLLELTAVVAVEQENTK